MTAEKSLGRVTHFFDRIGVAVIRADSSLKLGDRVHFLGSQTDFEQEIGSMQIEHEPVSAVAAGQEVAIKVEHPVRRGDSLFKATG